MTDQQRILHTMRVCGVFYRYHIRLGNLDRALLWIARWQEQLDLCEGLDSENC